jgi:hypothetical protein
MWWLLGAILVEEKKKTWLPLGAIPINDEKRNT